MFKKKNFSHLDEIAAQYEDAKVRAEEDERIKHEEEEAKRKELEAELAARKAAKKAKKDAKKSSKNKLFYFAEGIYPRFFYFTSSFFRIFGLAVL